MGWRGTALLAFLLVVAGAYLWFEESPPEQPAPPLWGAPQPREPTKAIPRLLDFKPADVVAVELERDGEVRKTARQQESWQASVDPRSIDDFLSNLGGLGVLAEIPAGAGELKDYGLAPPKSVLRLRLRDHTAPLVLLIGDHNPATTGVYVRLDESGPVLLAGALVAWEFDKAFKALRSAER